MMHLHVVDPGGNACGARIGHGGLRQAGRTEPAVEVTGAQVRGRADPPERCRETRGKRRERCVQARRHDRDRDHGVRHRRSTLDVAQPIDGEAGEREQRLRTGRD